ncbi:MAG: peptidylprolyl isomerase [Acidiferrobacterales bacterium]|jgi:peptidyl-prolyl cis-trans isomerase C|nr:peptidylprolyl isomerase [Acidiferrobacterales bacterium]
MHPIRVLTPLLLVSLLAVGGCNKESGGTGPIVATVNGESIRESEYKDILRAQFGTDKARNDTERQQAIDWLVRRKLLVLEAEKQKLQEREDVARAIRLSRDQLLIRAVTSKYLSDNPVSEEDAKLRYEALKKEKEYKVSHILLPSEAEANKVLAQLKAGKSFSALAKTSSLDEDSAKRGGEIGWINQHSLAPQLYFAAAGMKDGATSDVPVQSDYGWHVIHRTASRNTKLPPYDKIKQKLVELVQQERINNLTNHLREQAKVVISQ